MPVPVSMMHLAAAGFCLIGVLMIAFGIGHEVTWRRRRGWKMFTGTVVGNVADTSGEGGVTHAPEIEYHAGGASRRFVSKYGNGKPHAVGSTVQVLVSPSFEQAEVLDDSNRHLLTFAPLAFGAIFVAAGVAMIP